MDINPIALAIPVFFVLIGAELLLARARGRRVYAMHDTVVALSCGITSLVAGVLLKTVVLAGYLATWEHLRLADWSESAWWTWMVAFVLVDLAYYWWHRASHRVNFIWATHVVHHQSQEYNLAVALRQAMFTRVTVAPFYWPLALLGVPPVVFVACEAMNTLYQFWIHTRLVGRLGPVEWVMNTPSHHRVHHGVNPACIDRNYAGVFIVWDRLFGTFAPEPDEEPVYGTVAPYRSWNPVWANLEPWVKIWELSRSCTRWRDRLWAWVAPPEWRPAELGGPVEIPPARRDGFVAWDTEAPPGANAYALLWFLPTAAAITGLLLVEDTAALPVLAGGGALITATTLSWGALFEGRRWGLRMEVARLLAVFALAAGLAGQGLLPTWAALGLMGLCFMSVSWLWHVRRGMVAAPAPADG